MLGKFAVKPQQPVVGDYASASCNLAVANEDASHVSVPGEDYNI